MRVFRVYEMENLDGLKIVGEYFYTLEKLTEYLNSKKAYYRHYNEPITQDTFLDNIARACVDVIIPKIKNNEESLWEMMGLPNNDTLLRIFELSIIQ